MRANEKIWLVLTNLQQVMSLFEVHCDRSDMGRVRLA